MASETEQAEQAEQADGEPDDLDTTQFIHTRSGNAAQLAVCTTSARSHVMRRFHRKRRQDASKRQENFRHITPQEMQQKYRRRRLQQERQSAPDHPSHALAVAKFDPFNCFAADVSEVPVLLTNPLGRQAGEPVINFNADRGYQGLCMVFRSSMADPALLNAILLVLTFAVECDASSVKFLTYKGETLRWINQRLQDPVHAVSAATIGAILLFVGVETRLGAVASVKAHMRGVGQILQMCRVRNAALHDAIKRAIFWQDLFSAIMIGAGRVFDHDTFSELTWRRDPFRPGLFQTPIGFEAYTEVLGSEFLDIAADLRALQLLRQSTDVDMDDTISIMHLDNHQASVESRLYNLGKDPVERQNPTLYCAIIASYLSTYVQFTEVWQASMIPVHSATYLVKRLRSAPVQRHMHQHWHLFLWIICVGAAFAGPPDEQAEYVDFLHRQLETKAPTLIYEDLQTILHSFIWSEKVFGKRMQHIWQRRQGCI